MLKALLLKNCISFFCVPEEAEENDQKESAYSKVKTRKRYVHQVNAIKNIIKFPKRRYVGGIKKLQQKIRAKNYSNRDDEFSLLH